MYPATIRHNAKPAMLQLTMSRITSSRLIEEIKALEVVVLSESIGSPQVMKHLCFYDTAKSIGHLPTDWPQTRLEVLDSAFELDQGKLSASLDRYSPFC